MLLRIASSFALLSVSVLYSASMPKLLYRSSGITLKDGTQQALQNAFSGGIQPVTKGTHHGSERADGGERSSNERMRRSADHNESRE